MKSGGLPQLDITSFPSQLFWLAVTFVTLYLILARSIVPAIHSVLVTREGRISNDLDTAAKLKSEAAQAKETYEASLQSARAESHKMLAEVSATIKHNAEEKTRELDASLAKKLADAEKQIAKATEEAMSNLVPVASEVAGMVLTMLGNKQPDHSMVKATVEKLAKEIA